MRRHAPASPIGYRARSATARTNREMIPTTCDGNRRVVGKAKPVTLVATVVSRNRPFQPPRSLPPSRPNSTMSPEPIPIRLSTTCSDVNVDSVSPQITMCLPRLGSRIRPKRFRVKIGSGALDPGAFQTVEHIQDHDLGAVVEDAGATAA